MSKILIISLIFIFCSCGTNDSESQKVTICLSEDAYAYHNSDCMGLSQCNSSTKKMTEEEAVDIGRKPCGFCY